MFAHTVPSLLQLTGLNVCVCTGSASVNDDPFPSVKNPANNTLNESNVNHLKSTKFDVLPEPLPGPRCVALLDDCEEQGLRFLKVEL
jgi:hypothetical protein